MTSPGPQPIKLEGAVEGATFFDAVGGHPTFQRLVAAFYARVANDPVLRPLQNTAAACCRSASTRRELQFLNEIQTAETVMISAEALGSGIVSFSSFMPSK